MDRAYVKDFELHAYETDLEGKAQPSAILNYLQDIAGEHAAKLGFGFYDLAAKGLMWVLSRYHVRIVRYPDWTWGARLRVTTWPSGHHGVFALRDFEMTDAEGRVLALATSSWIMISLRTKQPVRVEEHIEGRVILPKRALDDAFPSLPACEDPEREGEFRVQFGDLDLNRHVNHVVYVRWALETVPPEVLKAKRPVEIEVAYKAEAFYGDAVSSRLRPDSAEAGSGFIHGIFNAAGGAELTRLRTRWG